ncbi:MAG: signal recognition particle-docking protein FtsY [Planctomycetota bacterium]|jgi:fused signal recognition particle receptor|nr:signal recognition particle-docking protein FtsY [Planctomycetota bacterium]MDP7134528.1 signal recognition particle-docking protein FtsY [Planctomycetota bacterium]
MALFSRIKDGLRRTRDKLSSMFGLKRKLDDDVIEEMEELLYTADIGTDYAEQLFDKARDAYENKELEDTDQLKDFLKDQMKEALRTMDTAVNIAPQPPTVILIVGVNGSGKTTSIAKLAKRFLDDDNKVLLGACDTFRAAAVDQLQIWAERLDVDIVKHQPGSDPAAVAYDATEAAVSRGMDALIIDTAGRLHTKEPLMRELDKIVRVIKKKLPDAPHETLIVLDATTGQNALNQAKTFKDVVGLDGVILAKLDGTAKGGMVLPIYTQLNLPVKFIGLGEKMEDLEPFDGDAFVEALFEE